jgi:hypothetical protein
MPDLVDKLKVSLTKKTADLGAMGKENKVLRQRVEGLESLLGKEKRRVQELEGTIGQLRRNNEEAAEVINSSYRERSFLLKALSCRLPARISRDEDLPPEDVWGDVLYLFFQRRWFGWHISPYDMHLFAATIKEQIPYDGHTTEEKYESLLKEIESW